MSFLPGAANVCAAKEIYSSIGGYNRRQPSTRFRTAFKEWTRTLFDGIVQSYKTF